MKAKIRGTPGVSMVFTLIVMMVVSIICASVLKVTSTAPVAAYSQQAYEQSYLSATSAAKLLQDAFTNRTNDNYATAIKLLEQVPQTGFVTFDLKLKKVDNTALDPLSVKVTLTKATDESPVTVSIAGDNASAGYPVNLEFGVYTVIWQDHDGNELARRIYPKNYPRGSVTPPDGVSLANYEDNGYYYTYQETTVNGNTTYAPVRYWKIIWLNKDRSQLCYENTGLDKPDTPYTPEGGAPTPTTTEYAESPHYYVFNGWDWEHATTNDTEKTITVSPSFTEQPLHIMIWQYEDGTEYQRQEYGNTTPSDPDVPVKESEHSTYYTYEGSWTVVSTTTDGSGVTTIIKAPTYQIKALQDYTLQWLNGDNIAWVGNAEVTLSGSEHLLQTYTVAAEAYEPTFSLSSLTTLDGQTPVKSDSSYFYQVSGWSLSDSKEGGNLVRRYTPTFHVETGRKSTHSAIYLNSDGSSIWDKLYYPEGASTPSTTKGSPTKTPTDLESYDFSEWRVSSSSGNTVTFEPVFSTTLKPQVWWCDVDGTPRLVEAIDNVSSPPTSPTGPVPLEQMPLTNYCWITSTTTPDSPDSNVVRKVPAFVACTVRYLNHDMTREVHSESKTRGDPYALLIPDSNLTDDLEVTTGTEETAVTHRFSGWAYQGEGDSGSGLIITFRAVLSPSIEEPSEGGTP